MVSPTLHKCFVDVSSVYFQTKQTISLIALLARIAPFKPFANASDAFLLIQCRSVPPSSYHIGFEPRLCAYMLLRYISIYEGKWSHKMKFCLAGLQYRRGHCTLFEHNSCISERCTIHLRLSKPLTWYVYY
jgi:hypothetical protein